MNKQEVFEYLDDLRESGQMNMFGAGPYVQRKFSRTRREAQALVVEWMTTFGERHAELSSA